MREILFRGKRLSDGAWVYGSLRVLRHGAIIDGYIDGVRAEDEVDAGTVGQFSGMFDWHRTRIFEGDLMRMLGDPEEIWEVAFGRCGGVQNITDEVGYVGFYLRPASDAAIRARELGKRDDPIYFLSNKDAMVMGNVHDHKKSWEGI